MCSSESLELWRERVAAVQQSGSSATQWCRENGIRPNLFYYWKHQVSRAESVVPDTQWLQTVGTEGTDEQAQVFITIKIAGAVIEVHSGFSPDLLRSVVQTLRSA